MSNNSFHHTLHIAKEIEDQERYREKMAYQRGTDRAREEMSYLREKKRLMQQAGMIPSDEELDKERRRAKIERMNARSIELSRATGGRFPSYYHNPDKAMTMAEIDEAHEAKWRRWEREAKWERKAKLAQKKA